MNKQNDIQLSEHFTLSEFTKSITAERLGIDNKPGYEQMLAMKRLCQEVLEPLRQHYGKPIRITSGYRCEALNRAVGGVGRSQHMLGEAADLSVPNEQVARDWFQWIVRNTNFDQLLFEHSSRLRNRWLHLTRCSSSTAVACVTAGCTSPASGTVSATAIRPSTTTRYLNSPPSGEGLGVGSCTASTCARQL